MFFNILWIFALLLVSSITAFPLSEHVESIIPAYHGYYAPPDNAEHLSKGSEDTHGNLHVVQLHLEQPAPKVGVSEEKEKPRALGEVEYTLPLLEKDVPFNPNAAVLRKVRHIGFGGGFGGFGGVIGGVSASPIYTSVPIVTTVPVTSTITTLPVVSTYSTIQTVPSYSYGDYGGYGGGSYGYNYKSFGFGGGFFG